MKSRKVSAWETEASCYKRIWLKCGILRNKAYNTKCIFTRHVVCWFHTPSLKLS